MTRKMILIDRPMLNKLVAAYDSALEAGFNKGDVIAVDEFNFVIGYLKYLIEFAQHRLGPEVPPTVH